MGECIAPTAVRASEVVRTCKQYLLHHGYPGRLSTRATSPSRSRRPKSRSVPPIASTFITCCTCRIRTGCFRWKSRRCSDSVAMDEALRARSGFVRRAKSRPPGRLRSAWFFRADPVDNGKIEHSVTGMVCFCSGPSVFSTVAHIGPDAVSQSGGGRVTRSAPRTADRGPWNIARQRKQRSRIRNLPEGTVSIDMLHRHLSHQRWTLAAIDDVISRGRWQDWADLRRAVLDDHALLDKVERVCRARVSDPYAQRHQFWLHYAEEHHSAA